MEGPTKQAWGMRPRGQGVRTQVKVTADPIKTPLPESRGPGSRVNHPNEHVHINAQPGLSKIETFTEKNM